MSSPSKMTMEADDVNLHDVEDYSCEGITHDQLPSVAEARATIPSKPKKSSHKVWYIAAGLLAFTVFVIAIAIPVSSKNKGSSEQSGNSVETTINKFAINGKEDFTDANSYQSIAKRWMLEDPLVQDYSKDQLQQRYAMYCLHHATGSNSWVDATGWKRKGVPECQWYGVTCDPVTNMVQRLNLRNNGLKGTIPPEVALIPDLSVFNVNANANLTGTVPDHVCDAHSARGLEIKVDCTYVTCDCCSNCAEARKDD